MFRNFRKKNTVLKKRRLQIENMEDGKMKRCIGLILIFITIVITISGCGFSFDNSGAPSSVANENGSGSIADVVAAFIPPARVTAIDFTANDPSNDDISFTFDAAGRITNVFYSANGHDVILGYVYEGDALDDDVSVWIIGFIDDIVVADERLKAANSIFDESIGFAEHRGYFIKGFNFP